MHPTHVRRFALAAAAGAAFVTGLALAADAPAKGAKLDQNAGAQPSEAVPGPVPSRPVSPQKPDPTATAMPGDPLPPDALREGYVETMEAALARAAARDMSVPDVPGKANIGFKGRWAVPSRRSTFYAHSGEHYAANQAGDPRMPLAFPQPVDVVGTYIAGQAEDGVWAQAVRVVGYRDGVEVGATDWFEDIDDQPDWMPINLRGVDRLVFEARTAFRDVAFFSIDDFTYLKPTNDPDNPVERIVVTFDDLGYRHTLTGTEYGGIAWQAGLTPQPEDWDPLISPDEPVHAPMRPKGLPDAKPEGDDGGAPQPVAPRGTATGPTLGTNFETVERGDAGSFSYPPDTCAAVGLEHVVMVVNRNFAVYDKDTGAELVNISLNNDFLPGSNGDPRVLYDQHAERWFVMNTDFDDEIFLAVSLTSDPTGSWYKTAFDITQGVDSGGFPDYPTLGVDEDGVYVSAYVVTADSMTIWAIDKAPLIAPVPSLGTITAFRGLPFEYAIQPAHTYGTPGPQYFLSASSFTNLRLRALNKPITSPTLVTVANIPVPFKDFPPNAPALGSGTPISTIDIRLMNAVYRDGFVYSANNIEENNRAAVRWYKVSTGGSLADSGIIADSQLYYYYGSISVNSRGDIAVGFSGSKSDQYVGCYYTGRLAGDTAGAMADPVLFKAGTGPQNNIDGFGRNRWGDYSLTSLDPVDELTIWTSQEFGKASDIWGTWVAELEFPAGLENDLCADAIDIGEESVAFDTSQASTDGPTDFGGCIRADKDIWYRYTATCDGEATADLCSVDFDAVVTIYNDVCPTGPSQQIACDEDACEPGALAVFPVTSGSSYLIRVGGQNDASGTGTLTVSCQPDNPCVEDLSGDDQVNADDLFLLLGVWGSAGGNGAADFNQDGFVNADDLFQLLGAWGACP